MSLYQAQQIAELTTCLAERQEQITRLSEANAWEDDRYRAALSFYADQKHWENNQIDIGVGNTEEPQSSQVAMNHGHIAKQALANRHRVAEFDGGVERKTT